MGGDSSTTKVETRHSFPPKPLIKGGPGNEAIIVIGCAVRGA